MKRQVFLCLCSILLAAASACAQESLSKTATAPAVDGVISAKEYTVSAEGSGMQVALSWVADTLYVAVTAQTTGWVAVGLGSPRMNGAVMYIGFVTGSKTEMKVQVGSGHSHQDTDTNAPVQYKIAEAKGATVLELALKASAFIAKGQKSLDMIVAFGSSDSFLSMHKAKASMSMPVTQ